MEAIHTSDLSASNRPHGVGNQKGSPNKQTAKSSNRYFRFAGFSVGLSSVPKDSRNVFFRNVNKHLPDYTALHSRR
jgi:hypothetical protein